MLDKKRFEQNQIFNTKYLIRDVFDLATLKELHEDIKDAIISKDEYVEFAELIWNEHNEEMKRPYKE